MENRLENYSFQRWGNPYVKGIGPRGGKIYGFREIYKTKIGDFLPEEWRKTVLEAIKDAGEVELLEKIKEHCRKHCAWLHKEKDIEEYSMECLVGRAYLHWEDFKGGVQMSETKNEQVEVVETVPAKMEFRLINPTEDGFLRTIKWNREELEAAVRAKVASYQNVVYTEDNLKQAKADRAELNKLTDAIEERRRQEEARRAEEERQSAEAARIETERAAQNQIAPEDVQDGTNQPETGTSGTESVSESAETGTMPWGNEPGPVSPMGKAIESVERQAFAAAVDPFAQKKEQPQPVKKVRTKFYAVGTMEQLKQLVAYMKENGIKYGKVE